MILGLLAWLRSETGGRGILSRLNSQDTINAYLEWLRSKQQSQVIAEINSNKTEFLSQLVDIAPQLTALADQIRSQAGDLTARLDDLNAKISPPVLYSIPLETRASASISLRCRDQEIEFLRSQNGDTLIVGQPGSGKTFLLSEFARVANAKFLLTDDSELAISAIAETSPKVVIVDDSWARQAVVARLRHVRKSHNFPFQIITVCWPFEKEDLQQKFQILPDSTLELECLPRKEIAEIINEVAASRKKIPNDAFIRIAAKQALGRPGLAVSLTLATIESSGDALVSGNLLLRDLGGFMQRYVSDDASVLLAAFACGGAKEISITEVANVLKKDIAATKAAADKIALVGTLEQTGKESLAVQPQFLRTDLIRKVFFPEKGGGLPWKLCEQLIASSVEPASGYLELFRVRSSTDARIEDVLLRKIASSLYDAILWESLAWIDAGNCIWALENCEDVSAGIKRAALYHIPERILPRLLTHASGDTRPLNSFPEADMRLIQDWIKQGADVESVTRRRALFDSTIVWLKLGENVLTGFEALRAVFDLQFETSDSDPADPRTIRIRSGAIPLAAVKEVFKLWPQFLVVVREQENIPWAKIVQIVGQWSGSQIGFGQPLPEDYCTYLEHCVRQMILDLVPLIRNNQAVSRWIYLKAKKRGIVLDKCSLMEEFMVLFPEENFDTDYSKREAEQSAAVQSLVDRWRDRALDEIIATFSEWQVQAENVGGMYTQMPMIFCSKLAESRGVSAAELSFILGKLPPQYITPFVTSALNSGNLSGDVLDACLSRAEFAASLIESTLTGKTPELYERVYSYIPAYHFWVGALCVQGRIDARILPLLLQHKSYHVRLTIACDLIDADSNTKLDDALRALWREAIVQGFSEALTSESEIYYHKLPTILDEDRTIALDILQNVLKPDAINPFVRGSAQSDLTSRLNRDERKTLLPLCKNLFYSDIPGLLVGSDLELYKEVLANNELEHLQLRFLAGDPTTNRWAAFAKAALQYGYKHRDLVNAGGFSWSGDMSNYYQQWVDRFEKLKNTCDPDLQQIGEMGLKRAISQRDACRSREKRERIIGED